MSFEEIDMILDRIENPVLKQTTEHLFGALDKSETEEDYDMNKATLVMFLGSVAPELLNSKINIDSVLHKSAEVSEDLEKKLKEVLAENGIYYFGPLNMDKHLLTGPESQGPLPKDPHGRNQEPHGNRPGKREMIGDIATLRRMKPEMDLPRRVEMLQMSHEDLLSLHQEFFGMTTTGSGKYIRNVETDSKRHRFRRREVESEGQAYHIRGRGQGKNSTDEMRVNRIKEIFSGGYVKPPKKVRLATTRPRVPGKDVANYEELGVRRNEQEQAHTSSTRGTNRARSALGTLSRSRDVSDHPEHGDESKVVNNPLGGEPALSATERAALARQAASGAVPPAKGQGPARAAAKPATVRPEPAPAAAAASAAAKPVKEVATAAKKPAKAVATAAKKPVKGAAKAPAKATQAAATAAKKPVKATASAAKKPAKAAATAAKKPAKAAGKGAKATKKPLRRAAALAAKPTKLVTGGAKPAKAGSLKSAVKRIMDARSKIQGAGASASKVKNVEQLATGFVSSAQHLADLMEQLESETNPARIENLKTQIREARRETIAAETELQNEGLGDVASEIRDSIGAGETVVAEFAKSSKEVFLERLNKIREKSNGA